MEFYVDIVVTKKSCLRNKKQKKKKENVFEDCVMASKFMLAYNFIMVSLLNYCFTSSVKL